VTEKDDQILKDYEEGRLPFSDLYQRATEEERCPDELALKILARGMEGEGAGTRPGRMARLGTWLRRRMDLWLPVLLAVMLLSAFLLYRGLEHGSPPPPARECGTAGPGGG